MNIEEYQKFVKEGSSPKYTKQLAVIGLVGEVGELSDVIKKESIYDDMSKFEEKYNMSVNDKIVDEAGDVFWQFINLIQQYEVSLEQIIDNNVDKLVKRHSGNKVSRDGGKR